MGSIKAAPTNNILVDVPSHALGRLNAARISVGVESVGSHSFSVSSAEWYVDRMDAQTGRLVRPSVRRWRAKLYDRPTGKHDRDTGSS